MTLLSKIEHIASLLEQCILYNNPNYRPFTGLSSPKETETERSTPVLLTTASTVSGKDTDVQCPQNSSESPILLLTIDLNFDIPLDQYLTHSTIPRCKTTNRRTSCKCKAEHKHYTSLPSFHRTKNREKTIAEIKTATLVKRVEIKPSTAATNFLSLPGEVREAIYAQIFANARVYISQKPTCRHAFDHHPAIRSTCKVILSETARAYFKSLTVKLMYQNFRLPDDTNMRASIPDSISQKLESLIVIGCDFSSHDLERVKLSTLPSLRTLTVVESGHLQFVASSMSETYLGRITEDARKSMKPNSDHWLSNTLHSDDRKYLLKWEDEDLSYCTEDRATHMGKLSKYKYTTVILSFSEDKKEEVGAESLSIDQIRARMEMYYWMAKQSKEKTRGSSGTDASTIMRWLDNMEYHATLDRIEAGVAKTMAKAAVTEEKVKTDDVVQ